MLFASKLVAYCWVICLGWINWYLPVTGSTLCGDIDELGLRIMSGAWKPKVGAGAD